VKGQAIIVTWTSLAVHAWASRVQALSPSLQSCPWHCTTVSQWALPIKRWRCCSFSSLLSSTRRSPGSTFEDQLWWSCICSRRASVMEQTTSNNPVIRHISRTNWKLTFCDGPFLILFHSSRARVPLNWSPCYGAWKLTFYYYYLIMKNY